ncbi:hypothetical protein GCM10011499_15760 [Pelagibacterium lentulum]|uniref:Uncharacterized protein n=1 Tax=Pelagibacterium lentulum TaxID=2029865 RepID=A0A916VX19_9HYPH|nr:hypothetical protein GCM10011499_15760 [Pelagibacterium lentulum]
MHIGTRNQKAIKPGFAEVGAQCCDAWRHGGRVGWFFKGLKDGVWKGVRHNDLSGLNKLTTHAWAAWLVCSYPSN